MNRVETRNSFLKKLIDNLEKYDDEGYSTWDILSELEPKNPKYESAAEEMTSALYDAIVDRMQALDEKEFKERVDYIIFDREAVLGPKGPVHVDVEIVPDNKTTKVLYGENDGDQ